MGPFEQQVEAIFRESGEKVTIQRTAAGYVVRGWGKAGKPIAMTVDSLSGAEAIKREVEAGKR